jgi:hypothetical protein
LWFLLPITFRYFLLFTDWLYFLSPIVLLLTWLGCFFTSSFFRGLQFAALQTGDAETKPVTRCDLETVA